MTTNFDYLKLREALQALAAKATPCEDVAVMWYENEKEGWRAPQFETERGTIAQEEADYEFYAALRTAWPIIEGALCRAAMRVTRVEIKNPSAKRGLTVVVNGENRKLMPGGSTSYDLAHE